MGRITSFIYPTIPLILSAISLLCILLIHIAGLQWDLGLLPILELAIVDASKKIEHVHSPPSGLGSTRVEWHNYTLHGLHSPLMWKRNPYFYINLWNYCTGTLSSRWFTVAYCSPPGNLVFNAMKYWKYHGYEIEGGYGWSDLHVVLTWPHRLHRFFVVALVVKLLDVLVVLRMGRTWRRRKFVILSLAWISILPMVATTVFAWIINLRYFNGPGYYERYHRRESVIEVRHGKGIYAMLWVALPCSAVAALLWTVVVFNITRQAHARQVVVGSVKG